MHGGVLYTKVFLALSLICKFLVSQKGQAGSGGYPGSAGTPGTPGSPGTPGMYHIMNDFQISNKY